MRHMRTRFQLDDVLKSTVNAVVCAQGRPVPFVKYFDAMITEYQGV